MSEKKQELKEFQMYPFMGNPRFQELEDATEYVDYYMVVKQDTLIQLDAVECGLTNAKINIAQMESKELLTVDFKAEYGKDNESIRKAHLQKINKELYEQLEGYKYQKKVLEHQLNILNDLLDANMILLGEHSCDCKCDR